MPCSRFFTLCLVICTSLQIAAQISKPDMPTLEKAVAYEYKGGFENRIFKVLATNQKVIVDSVELDAADLTLFENILWDTTTYGQPTASCFDPHHAVVLYARNHVILGVYDICMECNALWSNLAGIKKIKNHANSEGGPYLEGFSRMGRQRLKTFFEERGLSTLMPELTSTFDRH